MYHTQIHAQIHAAICTYTHSHMHTRKHTYTHRHADMHTYMHTHKHTYNPTYTHILAQTDVQAFMHRPEGRLGSGLRLVTIPYNTIEHFYRTLTKTSLAGERVMLHS